MYRVNISKLNEVDGIRTNISDKQEVSGTISVTANDGGDNHSSQIYVDGIECQTVPMLEETVILKMRLQLQITKQLRQLENGSTRY